MKTPGQIKNGKRVSYFLPEDLTRKLDEIGTKIGVPRNATLILAARKGIGALAKEYSPSEATA